jgi:hypothetical protein
MKRIILAAALCLASIQAHAQLITNPPSGFQRLFSQGASSGNGADLTEDTLTTCSTYSLPANTLANVGDTIRIVAGGKLGATTDARTYKVKLGSLIVVAVATSLAVATDWYAELSITKTGASTQSYSAIATSLGIVAFARSGTASLTDTAPIAVTVTGQNATNTVAGSVTCQMIIVDLMR